VAAVSTSVVLATLAKGVAGVSVVGRTGFGVSIFLDWERVEAETGVVVVAGAETGVVAGALT